MPLAYCPLCDTEPVPVAVVATLTLSVRGEAVTFAAPDVLCPAHP